MGFNEEANFFPEFSLLNHHNSAYSIYVNKINENILPERIKASIINKNCPITVIPINLVYSNWARFGDYINWVYKNKSKFIYDDSSLLRRRNGENEWY